MTSARDSFARILEQQDDAARRMLGMTAGQPLPPSTGATLGADPLDHPAEKVWAEFSPDPRGKP